MSTDRPVSLTLVVPALGDLTLQQSALVAPLSQDVVQLRAEGQGIGVSADGGTLQRVGGWTPGSVTMEAVCRVDRSQGTPRYVLQDGWLRVAYRDLRRLLAGVAHSAGPTLASNSAGRVPALVTAEGLVLPVPVATLFPHLALQVEGEPAVLALILRIVEGAWQWRLASEPPPTRFAVLQALPWVRLQAVADALADTLLATGLPRIRQLDLGPVEGAWMPGPPSLAADSDGTLRLSTSDARVLVAGDGVGSGADAAIDELLDDVPLQPDHLDLRPGPDTLALVLREGRPVADAPDFSLTWPAGQDDDDAFPPVSATYDLAMAAVPPGDRSPPPGLPRLWVRTTDGWLALEGHDTDQVRYGWGRSDVVTETRAVRLLPWLGVQTLDADSAHGQVELLVDNTLGTELDLRFDRDSDGTPAATGLTLRCTGPGLRCSAGRQASAGHDQADPTLPPLDSPSSTGPRALDLVLLSPRLIHTGSDRVSPMQARLVADGQTTGSLQWQVLRPAGLVLTWWRRLRTLPLVAPARLSANDPDATSGVSALRSLVPLSTAGSSELSLRQNGAGAPFLVQWDDDDALALLDTVGDDALRAPLPEHLGVEVFRPRPADAEVPTCELVRGVRAVARARYAVPFLDEHLRSTELVSDDGPVADALTWVQQRLATAPATDRAELLAGLEQARRIAWAAHDLDLVGRTEEWRLRDLGLRLLVEWSDPVERTLRRWSLVADDGVTGLFGIEGLAPLRLTVDGDGFVLDVMLGRAPHDSRLGLHLQPTDTAEELAAQPGSVDLGDGSAGRLVLEGGTLRHLAGDRSEHSDARWWVSSKAVRLAPELRLEGQALTVWLDDDELVRLKTDHGVQLSGGTAFLDPQGSPDNPVLVWEDDQIRARRRLHTNGLLIEERYRGYGTGPRLAIAVSAGQPTDSDWLPADQIDAHASGRRVSLAWAGQHGAPDASAFPYGPGFEVTTLNRLYIELERRGDGGSRVVGAFVGWTAGALFGLPVDSTVHPTTEGRREGPHLTFVLPLLETALGPEQVRGHIELNGVWSATREGPPGGLTHEVRVICWDSRVDLVRPDDVAEGTDADDVLEPTGQVPLLVRHELRDGSGDMRPTAWFAWQTARLGQAAGTRTLDLTAVHALRPWDPGSASYASAAAHRPGTLLIRATRRPRAALGTLEDGEEVAILGLPLILAAQEASTPPLAAQPATVAGWEEVGLVPPLSPLDPDASGAGSAMPWYAPQAARRLSSHPGLPEAFVIGERPRTVAGSDPAAATCEGFTLYREQPGQDVAQSDEATYWVACEVVSLGPPSAASSATPVEAPVITEDEAPREEPVVAAPPNLPAILRVFGEDGMERIHRIAAPRDGSAEVGLDAVASQSRAVLAWAGWHRWAILERPGPRWSLVDSPLPDWTAVAQDDDAPEAERVLADRDRRRIDDRDDTPLSLIGTPGGFSAPELRAVSLSRPPDRALGTAAYATEALNQWHPAYVRADLGVVDGDRGPQASLADSGDRLVLSLDRRVPFLVDDTGTQDLGIPRWTPGLVEASEHGRPYVAAATHLDLTSPRPGEQVTWGLAATALRHEGDSVTRLASAERVFTVRTPRSPDDQEEIVAVARTLGAIADGQQPWALAWKRYHPERYATDDPQRTVILAVQAPGDPRVLPDQPVRIWWSVLPGDSPESTKEAHGHLYLRLEAASGPFTPVVDSGGSGPAELDGAVLHIPLLPIDQDGAVLQPTDAESSRLPAHGEIVLHFTLAASDVPAEDDPPIPEVAWALSLAATKPDDDTVIDKSSDWTDRIKTLDPRVTVVDPRSRLIEPPPSFVTLSRGPADTADQDVLAHGSAPSTGWIAVEVPEHDAVRWMLEGDRDLMAAASEGPDPGWRVSVIGPDGSCAQAMASLDEG